MRRSAREARSGREHPGDEPLEARTQLELCEAQPPPHRAVLHPALQPTQEALRLAPAFRSDHRAEIERCLEMEGVEREHLPQQELRERPLPLRSKLLAPFEERIDRVDLAPAA